MNLVSLKATRLLSTWVVAGMVMFAATPVNTHAASTERTSASPTGASLQGQPVPPECTGIPLEAYAPEASPVANTWSTLRVLLADQGFSTSQVNRLQEAFGGLHAEALRNLGDPQMLPVMTGQTVQERQEKIAVFRQVVEQVASCHRALQIAMLAGMSPEPPATRTTSPGAWQAIQVDLFRGGRVLDERGSDVSAMFRVEAAAGRGGSLGLRVAVDPRVRPGRYRVELIPARPEVAPVFVVVVLDRTGRVFVPADAAVPVSAPGPAAPVAVLDVPAMVAPGTAFELSGQGSSAASPGAVVRWRFTRVEGPGASASMPLGVPVETDQPRFTVAGGLAPGLHTFRLVVLDDSGNQSVPAEATVRVADAQAPTAMLDVPAMVAPGTAFELSGQGSSAASPGAVVRWRFTRVEGPGASASMPLGVPVETDQPRFTVAGGLAPGLHTFRLVVLDDSGNQSVPAEAAVRVEEASATRTRAVDWSGTVLIPGNDAPVGSELVIRPPAGARLPRVAVSLAGQNLRLISASPREVRVRLPARPLSGPLMMTNVDARASGLLVREYRVIPASAETSDPGYTCRGASDATSGLDAEEQAFLQILNNYRVQNRLGPVRACASLNRASQGHSENMRDQNYLSHVSLDGRSPGVRACEACYERGCHSGIGENIAAGSAGAQATFDQWRSSPEHNANMLNGGYTVIGIGRATGGGQYGVYWTVKFATQDEPSCD